MIGKENTATEYDTKASKLESDAAKIGNDAQQVLKFTEEELTALKRTLGAEIENDLVLKGMFNEGKILANELDARLKNMDKQLFKNCLAILNNCTIPATKRFVDKYAMNHQVRMLITNDRNTFSDTVGLSSGMRVSKKTNEEMQAKNRQLGNDPIKPSTLSTGSESESPRVR